MTEQKKEKMTEKGKDVKGAIVTGSAHGLGRAIALMLAKEGYAVAINFRKSRKDAAQTLKELRKINEKCIAIQGDLTKEADVKRLVTAAKRAFGRIDILVNNVGDFLYKPLLETTPAEMEEVFRNNVITAFSCSQYTIPIMRSQRFGRIILIGSVGCDKLFAPINTTPYYMAKTSVLLLAKALAKTAGEGITANVVNPGILETSVVTPRNVKYTRFEEITLAIKKLIKGNSNGAYVTVARWQPEG